MQYAYMYMLILTTTRTPRYNGHGCLHFATYYCWRYTLLLFEIMDMSSILAGIHEILVHTLKMKVFSFNKIKKPLKEKRILKKKF